MIIGLFQDRSYQGSCPRHDGEADRTTNCLGREDFRHQQTVSESRPPSRSGNYSVVGALAAFGERDSDRPDDLRLAAGFGWRRADGERQLGGRGGRPLRSSRNVEAMRRLFSKTFIEIAELAKLLPAAEISPCPRPEQGYLCVAGLFRRPALPASACKGQSRHNPNGPIAGVMSCTLLLRQRACAIDRSFLVILFGRRLFSLVKGPEQLQPGIDPERSEIIAQVGLPRKVRPPPRPAAPG